MTVSALRTIVIGAAPSIYGVCPVEPLLRWTAAGVASDLDWSIDVTAPFADVSDPAVAMASWAIAPSGSGERTITNISVSGFVITGQLIGGVAGRDYQNSFLITGTSGRVWPWTIGQRVDPWAASWPLVAPTSLEYGPALTWTLGGATVPPGFVGGPSITGNLVAIGTNQATALLLLAQTNIFISVPPGTGAVLNATLGNGNYRVINASGNDLPVYPPGTAQIGTYGAGNPVIVGSNNTVDFATLSPATQWYAS